MGNKVTMTSFVVLCAGASSCAFEESEAIPTRGLRGALFSPM